MNSSKQRRFQDGNAQNIPLWRPPALEAEPLFLLDLLDRHGRQAYPVVADFLRDPLVVERWAELLPVIRECLRPRDAERGGPSVAGQADIDTLAEDSLGRVEHDGLNGLEPEEVERILIAEDLLERVHLILVSRPDSRDDAEHAFDYYRLRAMPDCLRTNPLDHPVEERPLGSREPGATAPQRARSPQRTRYLAVAAILLAALLCAATAGRSSWLQSLVRTRQAIKLESYVSFSADADPAASIDPATAQFLAHLPTSPDQVASWGRVEPGVIRRAVFQVFAPDGSTLASEDVAQFSLESRDFRFSFIPPADGKPRRIVLRLVPHEDIQEAAGRELTVANLTYSRYVRHDPDGGVSISSHQPRTVPQFVGLGLKEGRVASLEVEGHEMTVAVEMPPGFLATHRVSVVVAPAKANDRGYFQSAVFAASGSRQTIYLGSPEPLAAPEDYTLLLVTHAKDQELPSDDQGVSVRQLRSSREFQIVDQQIVKRIE